MRVQKWVEKKKFYSHDTFNQNTCRQVQWFYDKRWNEYNLVGHIKNCKQRKIMKLCRINYTALIVVKKNGHALEKNINTILQVYTELQI